ncbi:hypothetical protein C8Q80DRAFT_1091181 [Daedaleopsis nitida]|nr:hypothetical protein C8Q80DRAFT_1091181 [Daedaleopsis nitida]
MRVVSLLAAVAALLGTASAASFSPVPQPHCSNPRVAYTTFIGQDKNVEMQVSQCADASAPLVDPQGRQVSSLTKRQSSNVCGAACNTFCWTPATGGPSAADCTVIADALLYESQNTGVLFNVSAFGTPTNQITMKYNTCLTYFLNQDATTLTYCRTEWSNLVNWLASDCSASNGARGGLCVASDQRWYVQ